MPASIPCPCCRAVNDTGPTCRRCKADLSALFALESHREFLLTESRRLSRLEQFADALAAVDQAQSLRAGTDTRQLRAALLLLNRDYSSAWSAYHDLHPAK